MNLFNFFKSRRRAHVLRKAQLDAAFSDAQWQRELEQFSFTRALYDDERARLKALVILFLAEKPINGAGNLHIDDGAKLAIAIQACMLILNLDLDWYRPWTEIIVYPGEFVAKREEMDEAGVVHVFDQPMSGESWGTGTVVLSWADAQKAGKGDGTAYNVVIHEFAHQLDMLNGEANGFPPLHKDMKRAEWAAVFKAAYEHFCKRVERWEDTIMDHYAAESPAEFFAVVSEAFIETPAAVRAAYPDVYAQLTRFYRQDPAVRADHAR